MWKSPIDFLVAGSRAKDFSWESSSSSNKNYNKGMQL